MPRYTRETVAQHPHDQIKDFPFFLLYFLVSPDTSVWALSLTQYRTETITSFFSTMNLQGGYQNAICSGLDENTFQKQETLGMTLILAQTPAFLQTGRTGQVLAIAMADKWEMLTLPVHILRGILQREEGFLAFWEICASGNTDPELKYRRPVGPFWQAFLLHPTSSFSSSLSQEAHTHHQHLKFTYTGSSTRNSLPFYSKSVTLVQWEKWSFSTSPSLSEGIASVKLGKHYSLLALIIKWHTIPMAVLSIASVICCFLYLKS